MTTNDPLSGTGGPPGGAAAVNGAVRAELARARVSGRQLARDLGVSPHYVARRLSGRCAWSVVDLHRAAALLDVDPAVLLAPRPVRAPLGVAS